MFGGEGDKPTASKKSAADGAGVAVSSGRPGADALERQRREAEAHEFHRFFPAFTWVIRDFVLELVDEYGEAFSSDDYLEASLAPQVGFDAKTVERNRIRQCIAAFFPARRCVTLPRPLTDEARLQAVDAVPHGELRVEFRSGLAELRTHLFGGYASATDAAV